MQMAAAGYKIQDTREKIKVCRWQQQNAAAGYRIQVTRYKL
jgi:hypothetical protein